MIMHPGIKLRHLRVFLDIAARGSLTAAARAQGITQPALSRTLAELEALLQVPLFRRERRRLVLTDAGTLLRTHAAAALQMLESGVAALHPVSGTDRLRVGILPTAATRLFPRVALRFREMHPHVTLSVETGPHPHLIRLLREGGIDLMIGRMPAAADMAGLRFDHLYEDQIALVSRAGHPCWGQPVRDVLSACPVILPPQDALIRRAVDDYLQARNLAGLHPAFETAALAVGRGILAASDALWFISQGVVGDELDRGALIQWPTDAGFLTGAVGLTRRQVGPDNAMLDVLTRLATDGART
jgi:LysR family pca operon transcriptional activator